MADSYAIECLSPNEIAKYKNYAINAIENIRSEIGKLENTSDITRQSPPFSYTEPHEMTLYLKDILKIDFRDKQIGEPTTEQSYYYSFIPTNNPTILVNLRVTDHKRGDTWNDRYDDGKHPNVRANTIIIKDGDEITKDKTAIVKSNGTPIRKITLNVPTKIFGQPEKIIALLNSWIYLFKEGKFGRIKEKPIRKQTAKEQDTQNNVQTESINRKRTIRLTESKLRNIVRETVVDILSETDFKQVDNLGDYISQNGLQMRPASKFQRVNAQSGKSYINQYGKGQGMDKRKIGRMVRKGGAPLTTVAGDGTQETNNMVTRNHTVLNNVGNTNNRWAAETPTFNRKYEQDTSAQGVYKPKGGPMNAAQINEPISFTAPWGEKMNIDKGGYILQDPNNPNDAYGISGKDFDSTYRFNEEKNNRLISKNMKQTIRLTESELHNIIRNCVSEAMNEGLFGTPLFGNDKKYGEKWYDPNTWLTKQQKKQQDEYEKKWSPIRKERERQRQQVEREREEKRQAERRQKEWREHQYDKYGGYEGYLAYCKAEYEKRHPYSCHAGETYYGGTSAYDAGLR